MLFLLGGPKWEYDLVFCTETGKPLEVRNVSRALYKILDDLGIEQIGVHPLRHTFATRAKDSAWMQKLCRRFSAMRMQPPQCGFTGIPAWTRSRKA